MEIDGKLRDLARGAKGKKSNSKPEEFETLAEWQAWRDTQRAKQAEFTPLPKDFTF